MKIIFPGGDLQEENYHFFYGESFSIIPGNSPRAFRRAVPATMFSLSYKILHVLTKMDPDLIKNLSS
jgi:hypothetical protein